MKVTINTAGHPADAYGRLKAVQAELAAEEKRLKERLLELERGAGYVEGNLYRVSISHISEAQYFDGAKAKEYLSPALVAACMSTRAASIRFAAKARVANASVAAE